MGSMPLSEPIAIAAVLLTVGVLLILSALFSRASARFGVPGFLIFLVVGMLAGSEGIGGIPSMFLMLGLLVFPSRLLAVAPTGLALGLFLAFVARPVVVFLCLLPFRYGWRESLYVGWVGLRGAVPIILATMPVMAGVPAAEPIFHLVFFIVVVTAVVPGGTVGWVTRRLGLASGEPAPPAAVLEINSLQPLAGDIVGFTIEEPTAACGATISQLPFPPGANVMLLIRGEELIAPRGTTLLGPGDHLFVFCKPEDRAFIDLLFGRHD